MNNIILSTEITSDGSHNYNLIKNAHQWALDNSTTVIYPPNCIIYLVIPVAASSIPLGPGVHDFNGCRFIVSDSCDRNCNYCLFKYENNSSVNLNTYALAKNKLKYGISVLPSGVTYDNRRTLLTVKDGNIWTCRSGSATENFYRRDIFLIENGYIKNNPISTYDNTYTSFQLSNCHCYELDGSSFVFKNLHFTRFYSSLKATDLLTVNGHENILIQNVEIYTPHQYLVPTVTPDACIYVRNSYNVTFENITIQGTYSSVGNSGYGIHLDNVYNTIVKQLSETAIWGIFCTYNLNKFYIEYSQLNRVDVHCYGKDIHCKNCTFRNNVTAIHTYNRFASFFGTLKYENCIFNSFNPVRLDQDYLAFTPFDVEFLNCTFNISTGYIGLIYAISLSPYSGRSELSRVNLPSVTISNATINITGNLSTLYIFRFGEPYNNNVYHLHDLMVDFQSVSSPVNTNLSETNHHINVDTEGHGHSRTYFGYAIGMINNTYGISFDGSYDP